MGNAVCIRLATGSEWTINRDRKKVGNGMVRERNPGDEKCGVRGNQGTRATGDAQNNWIGWEAESIRSLFGDKLAIIGDLNSPQAIQKQEPLA